MQVFIDEHGKVRDADVAAIAAALGIVRPGFDIAAWVVKALGWVELTLGPMVQRLVWRPALLRAETAETAREMVIEADALAPILLVRWTDRWQSSMGDGMEAAWALGARIGPNRQPLPAWRIARRAVADLYRDRNLGMIEDLSRVAGRSIDHSMVRELVEMTPSGQLGMVESRGPGCPFHYLRVGRHVRLFDCPEAYIGRDLRESSDPAFSTVSVASYKDAMVIGEPVVEDVEGPVQFADGRIYDIAYRRVLLRVSGSAKGPAIVMKTSEHLRPPMLVA